MALIAYSGFDLFSSITDMGQFFDTAPNGTGFAINTAGNGRNGNTVSWVVTNATVNANATKSIPGSPSTLIVGFGYKYDSLASARSLCSFREGGTIHTELNTTSTGALWFARNGTQIGPTSAVTLSNTAYQWIEVKVTIHDTLGAVEVRVNGVAAIAATGLDTRNGGTGIIDSFVLANGSQSVRTGSYDDLIILDTSGSAPYNDFLGDVIVHTLRPSGAGSVTQWTPSTGSNYTCVDDIPQNTTDYVSDSTVGHQDLYAMTDLATASGLVYGVKVTGVAQKSDAGSTTLKLLAKSGGTTGTSAGQALNAGAYKEAAAYWTADPGTGAAWTVSGVNSMECGMEVA